MASSRIYVGGLPSDVQEKEVDSHFGKYGRIRTVDIKGGRDGERTAFAFVDFGDERDAQDACREENGRDFLGNRLRVRCENDLSLQMG